MSKIELFKNVLEENGKTVFENNMKIQHNIPIGTLVEVKFDEWYGDGACSKIHARLWVIEHGRDCDGEPLYSLSRYHPSSIPEMERYYGRVGFPRYNGFVEESLTVVEVTENLKRGEGSLHWERGIGNA